MDMAQQNKTDIIPGKYEGGLKVWECSIDLCIYLYEQIQLFHMNNKKKKKKKNNNKTKGDMDMDMDTDMNIDNDVQRALSNGGTTVELGCGHGLPGCLILKEIMNMNTTTTTTTTTSFNNNTNNNSNQDNESPIVLFTDYNSFVLRDVTLPNIILNCMDDNTNTNQHNHNNSNNNLVNEKEKRMKVIQSITGLVAGDWMELSNELKHPTKVNTPNLMQRISSSSSPSPSNLTTSNTNNSNNNNNNNNNPRFDLILASETTYTLNAAKETAYWLHQHLTHETGIGLVSMKRYYFGVGGGSDSFRDACLVYGLDVSLVREYKDGSSNIRDLWRVRL